MNRHAISTLELLIVMVIVAVVGIALMQFIQSGNQAGRLQEDLSALEQSAAIAAEVLSKELSLAGYRGNPDPALGQMTGFTGPEAEQNQARSLSWLASLDHWRRFAASGVMLSRPNCSGPDPQTNLETLLSFGACSKGGDEIWLRLVEKVEGNGYPNLLVRHREVRFRLDGSNRELERRSQDFQASLSLDAPPNSIGLSPTSNPTWQPLTNHLEDFQVFFLSTTGWTPSRPPTRDFQAIGIYLRMRSEQATGPSRCTWPQLALPGGLTPTGLEIPSKVYTGRACQYRRLERVLSIRPGSPQHWE
jgi:type II secretory pathway component PulJ